METLILKCLLKKGVAVVPDLGTFRLQHQSARLLKDDSMKFVPPQNIVTFSTDCVDDDSFKSFVAKKTQKSEDETLHLLRSYAVLVKNVLQKQESFQIKGVGVIKSDWSFVSQLSKESSPETFGLADFSIDTVSETEKKNAELKVKNFTKSATKTMILASPILFGALLIPSILQISNNPQFASVFRRTQVAVNSSAPEIPSPHQLKSTVAKTEKIVTETPTVATSGKNQKNVSQKKDQAAAKNANKVVTKTANKGVVKKGEKSVDKKATNNAGKKYYVVVGTFSNAEYAYKYAKQLQNKYESGVIEGEQNKVYISAFSSRQEAVDCTRQLRENTTYPNAWIYVKNS